MNRPIVYLMAVLLLATSAHAAPLYKDLPTARDNAEMESRLRNGEAFVLADFEANAPAYHWTGFYEAANQLLQKGKSEAALKWYYVGQIRGRLAAGLDPDPSRNDALLSSLNYGLGKPLEEYAKAHAFTRLDAMAAALAWDAKYPLPADPKHVIGITEVAFDTANFQVLYAQIREGLAEYRATLAKDAPSFRTKGD